MKCSPNTVKINGKYYTKFCPKCGGDKNLKSPYCPPCYRISLNKPVKKKKETPKNPELKGDYISVYDLRTTVLMENTLIEFYERVENRRFQVSLQEIFVEMITLFNYFGKNQTIDLLPVGKQLAYMWKILKLKYEVVKANPTKIKRPNATGRRKKYTKSRIFEPKHN